MAIGQGGGVVFDPSGGGKKKIFPGKGLGGDQGKIFFLPPKEAKNLSFFASS